MIAVYFTWFLSLQCQPTILEDWYIFTPNNFSYGYRNINPNHTSVELAVNKPRLGCAIAWKFDCHPVNLTIDGENYWSESP